MKTCKACGRSDELSSILRKKDGTEHYLCAHCLTDVDDAVCDGACEIPPEDAYHIATVALCTAGILPSLLIQ